MISEFYMELRVPKCALKGLELQDIMFNDDVTCGLTATEDGNHYVWQIDYNDCGTTKSVSFFNLIKNGRVRCFKPRD